MSENKPDHPVLTQEELDALLTPREKQALLGVDNGFRWRHIFLAVLCTGFIVRLLFFPEIAASYFDFPGPELGRKVVYLQMRGWLILVGASVYLFSYLRDWYFPKVSLVIFAMSLSSLCLDLINIYAYTYEGTPKFVTAMILLRLAAVYLLFLSAIRSSRLPPMPRGFFS
jgi:hypothetical protein